NANRKFSAVNSVQSRRSEGSAEAWWGEVTFCLSTRRHGSFWYNACRTECPMPLPGFREDGWLPEGHHLVTWEEVIVRFGGPAGSKRARILENLLRWRDRLTEKRITGKLILNGSFISAKPDPADFDAILIADD